MSVVPAKEVRLLRVSEANLRNSHLSVRNDLDFFPPDCLGPSRKPAELNGPLLNTNAVAFQRAFGPY